MAGAPIPKSFHFRGEKYRIYCQTLPEGKSKKSEAMVKYFFLPRLESRETFKIYNEVGKSYKCQEDLHFLINIFTIIREIEAKCMV